MIDSAHIWTLQDFSSISHSEKDGLETYSKNTESSNGQTNHEVTHLPTFKQSLIHVNNNNEEAAIHTVLHSLHLAIATEDLHHQQEQRK
jgi:hypothetical protein